MKLGGIGVPELIIILVVVLLIFGPKNLPKLGSALGKGIKSLREGMNGGKEKDADAADDVEAASEKKAEKKDEKKSDAE
ncbi:twin-arginine translocase TatA/TatE family subunit [Hugonella massiliensis]|uniref:twin-arginine translocase TatA/TatE family subunit n=1 Tax=Hugonella massiliensis TaxID=1720315 RepID=UPI00073F8173|nr:twin-arginine translocase TatA/TatE family subunit [Hugonella massiliensis]MDD6730154.1 twin-arginine translocase TatA/TatE family subunit [Eggerthellaceae bacterium]